MLLIVQHPSFLHAWWHVLARKSSVLARTLSLTPTPRKWNIWKGMKMVKCYTSTKQKWKQKSYFWPKAVTASLYWTDTEIYFCLLKRLRKEHENNTKTTIMTSLPAGSWNHQTALFSTKSCSCFYNQNSTKYPAEANTVLLSQSKGGTWLGQVQGFQFFSTSFTLSCSTESSWMGKMTPSPHLPAWEVSLSCQSKSPSLLFAKCQFPSHPDNLTWKAQVPSLPQITPKIFNSWRITHIKLNFKYKVIKWKRFNNLLFSAQGSHVPIKFLDLTQEFERYKNGNLINGHTR